MTRYYHSSTLHFRFNSVSQNLNRIIHLALFVLVVFSVSSCEENPTIIGSRLLPGKDSVEVQSTDTLSVLSFTMYDKSVRSDNPSVSYFGQIYDPYFGTTTTEFVTQIRLGSPWDDLSFTIDSVKLYLYLLDVKGGSPDVTNYLRLSEISDQIYTDSAYYSDKSVPFTGYVIPDIALPALEPDTVNSVILTLPIEFGNYLTRDTSMLFHSNTKPDFRSFFKGLNFRIISGSVPVLAAISVAPITSIGSYKSYLVLFMHDAANEIKEYYFMLDAVNRNASFNKYSHDFTTATLGDKMGNLNDTSYSNRDTVSYLQCLSGVYTKITFPGLESLKNDLGSDHFAINKARLTIPAHLDGDLYKASTIPSQLFLRYKTSNGIKYLVPDYSGDPTFFDGSLDSTNCVYNFNIPAFVQGYLEDKTSGIKPELEVYLGGGTRNVILKTNESTSPVKFELTYTKF